MLLDYLLGITQLTILYAAVGIGPLLFFNKVIKATKFYSYLAFSIMLGLVITPIVHLTVGHFGLPVVGAHYKAVQIALLTLSAILVFVSLKDKGIKKKLKDRKILKSFFYLDYIDIFFLLFFTLYFILTIVLNGKDYFPKWDQFNFWLTDAKIAYITGALRVDGSYINEVLYGSFMPIHYVEVYEVFGKLVEQFASYITILFSMLATFISYYWCKRYTDRTRIVAGVALILVNIIMSGLIFNTYAELAMASYTVFAIYLMLQVVKQKQYNQKLFLIALVMFGFSILKVMNSVYTIFIIGFFVLYDIEQIKTFFKKENLLHISNLVYFGIILFLVGAQNYYRQFVLDFELHLPYTQVSITESLASPLKDESPLAKLYSNFYTIARRFKSQFAMRTFLFLFVWLFGLSKLGIEVYKAKTIRVLHNYGPHIFLLTLVLMLPLINIAHFSLSGRASQLDRYVLPTVYALPMTLAIFTDEIKKNQRLKLYILMILIIALFIFFPTARIKSYYSSFQNPPTTGSYLDAPFFADHSLIAKELSDEIGDETIFFAKYHQFCTFTRRECLVNNRFDTLIMNYLMIENRASGTYVVQMEDFIEHMKSNEMDYILLMDSAVFAATLDEDVDEKLYFHFFEFDPETEEFEYIKGYERTVSDEDQF